MLDLTYPPARPVDGDGRKSEGFSIPPCVTLPHRLNAFSLAPPATYDHTDMAKLIDGNAMITRTTYTIDGIALEVVRGPSGANILHNGTSVAHARMRRNVWLITVPGHVWPVTADMPSARFNITTTPCKSFRSRAAALAEVARIITL